jgi:hypothetical protein
MNVPRSLVVEIISPALEIQDGFWRVTSTVFHCPASWYR